MMQNNDPNEVKNMCKSGWNLPQLLHDNTEIVVVIMNTWLKDILGRVCLIETF